jgi:hypothetical protein
LRDAGQLLSLNMAAYIDKQAADALSRQDMQHWNRERYKKAKRGSVLLTVVGVGFILGTHFGISPAMSAPFLWGIVLTAFFDVLLMALFGKILWKTAAMSLHKTDFDYLKKWELFELINQAKISAVSASIASGVFMLLERFSNQ